MPDARSSVGPPLPAFAGEGWGGGAGLAPAFVAAPPLTPPPQAGEGIDREPLRFDRA